VTRGIVPEQHTQELQAFEAQLREQYREQLADERTRAETEHMIEARVLQRMLELGDRSSVFGGFILR
jgi:hypothetical protein